MRPFCVAVVMGLTASGCAERHVVLPPDSSVAYSPNGGLVAFVRATGPAPEQTELWVSRRDGSLARRLVSGRLSEEIDKRLVALHSPTFSENGLTVYFQSRTGGTSSALHEVSLLTGREHYSGFDWDQGTAQELDWTQTIDSLKELSSSEREAILNVLAAQMSEDSVPRESATEARMQLTDLNADGVPEIIVQATGWPDCGMQNCPFWILEKTANGYRLLFDDSVSIQNFTIQPSRTNGYSDLVLEMHGSAWTEEMFFYRYKNGSYRRIACYDAWWIYPGSDGENHELLEPRVKATEC